MSVDLVDAILFLAPGFLALKLFYLFGAQRPRSQWEWTTWSVIVSLPVVGIAALLRDQAPASAGVDPDPAEVALRLAVAIAAGAAASVAWQRIRASRDEWANELRMAVTDSAWDQALEDAQIEGRALVLVLEDEEYRGTLRYGDRDDNEAEGWLYLMHPEIRDPKTKKFRPANATNGILVHRDQVKRIRILDVRREPEP